MPLQSEKRTDQMNRWVERNRLIYADFHADDETLGLILDPGALVDRTSDDPMDILATVIKEWSATDGEPTAEFLSSLPKSLLMEGHQFCL